MSKTLLSIMLVALICGSCQGLEYGDDIIHEVRQLFVDSIEWRNGEKKYYSDLEKKCIMDIIHDASHRFCDDEVWQKQVEEWFHFIDLDGDSDRDVVFNGLTCPGLESESVLIFMNMDGKYKISVDDRGRIARIDVNNGVIIHRYPCCDMILNEIVAYQITTNRMVLVNGITFFHTKLECFFPAYEKMFPKEISDLGEVHIEPDTKVRFSPQDEFPAGGILRNNILGSLESSENAPVHSSVVDEDGTFWYYCKLSPDNLFTEENYNFPVLAWIKKRAY